MDNLIASMKSGLDGVADALGFNDARFVIHAQIMPLAVNVGGVLIVLSAARVP